MTTGSDHEATPARVALVTGGTRGIGQAIATAFSERGCELIVTGLEADECDQTRQKHPTWNVRQLDICNASAIETLAGSLSRIDVLVNAAGIILRDAQEHETAGFEHVVDVNLNGTMRVSTACHQLLAANGGCVLNLASMLSFFGSGYAPAYSASKGGVVQLTKSLAIAWSVDGIRVNAIAPGWIKTAMTNPLVTDPQRSRAIVDRTPLGRWGDPADVIGPALFLCSPAAAFITGAVLPVDGGYSIT